MDGILNLIVSFSEGFSFLLFNFVCGLRARLLIQGRRLFCLEYISSLVSDSNVTEIHVNSVYFRVWPVEGIP